MGVTAIFNKMAPDYDNIQDLWYSWLFSRLHFIIAKNVINEYKPKTVLDVGCGTGFQSFLHAIFGASVVGIDIAEDLIAVAQKKTTLFPQKQGIHLFPVHFEFVDRYNKLICSFLSKKGRKGIYTPPCFQVADARHLPFQNETFDHVNCCGSTLNFIETPPHHVLSELTRVLKSNGTLLLEIDSRWNMDLFWVVVDSILKNKFGYASTLNEALNAIFAPPGEYITVKYPFDDFETPTSVHMKLRLFTVKWLRRELSEIHFKILKRWSIHSVTNLIPSKYLGISNPSKRLRRLFAFFAYIEERLPITLPGCSLVFLARKKKV